MKIVFSQSLGSSDQSRSLGVRILFYEQIRVQKASITNYYPSSTLVSMFVKMLSIF